MFIHKITTSQVVIKGTQVKPDIDIYFNPEKKNLKHTI